MMFLIRCSTPTVLPVTLYQEIQRFGRQMLRHELVCQGIKGIVGTPTVKQLFPLRRIPGPGVFPVLVGAAADVTLPARDNIPGNAAPADVKRESIHVSKIVSWYPVSEEGTDRTGSYVPYRCKKGRNSFSGEFLPLADIVYFQYVDARRR